MKNWRLQGATEDDNKKAVRQILMDAKEVLEAQRRNSGAMPTEYERKDGTKRKGWTQFHELLRWPGGKVHHKRQKNGRFKTYPAHKVLDFEGWLVDGRYFGIEVKPGDWTRPTCEREWDQLARIQMIQGPPINGVAAFIINPDQVLEMINPAMRRVG